MTRLVPGSIAASLVGLLLLQWLGWPPPYSTAGLETPPTEDSAHQDDTTDHLAARLTPPAERERYASILERPIFRPDRKPEPPDDQPDETLPSSDKTALETMDLTAVLISPSLVSAWVKDPAKSTPERLRIGDDVAGWQVREIRGDRVLLERQGETYPLLLRDYSKQPPANTTPAPITRRAPRNTGPSDNRPAERQRPLDSRPNAPRP